MALDAKRIEQIIAAPDFTLSSKAEYQGRRLKLYCKQTEQSKQEKKSLIEWVARSEGGSVNWYNTGPTTIKIGSQTVINALPRPGLNWNFPTGRNSTSSGSFTVIHNEDGTINPLNVSIKTAIYWGDWNLKTTDPIQWKLKKMDRKFTKEPTLKLTTKSMDLIQYSWETSEACSKIDLYVDGVNVQPLPTETTQYRGVATINEGEKSGTILFAALKPNTQYALKAVFTRKDTGLTTEINLTPQTHSHPCVKQISKEVIYPKSEIEERTQTVTIENYSGAQVKVYMGLINNDTSSDSVIATATLTDTGLGIKTVELQPDRNSIYEKLKNTTSAVVYYYCETTINEIVYKSQNTVTGKIAILGTEKPNLSSMVVQWRDSNTNVTKVTSQGSLGTNKWMVQNLSDLTTIITNEAASVGQAPIQKYTFTLGKISIDLTPDKAIKEFHWDSLNLVGPQKLTITVTDSRGMTSSVEKTITFYEYRKPFATIAAERINNYGTNVSLECGYRYSKVNGVNGLKVYCTNSYSSETVYFLGGTSSYAAPSDESGNLTRTLSEITNDESVNFTIYITDLFSEVAQSGTARIERGQPIFFVDELNSGVGVNCFPKGEGLWATRIYLNGRTYITMENDAIVFRVEG